MKLPEIPNDCKVCELDASLRESTRNTTPEEQAKLKGPFMAVWNELAQKIPAPEDVKNAMATYPRDALPNAVWDLFESTYLQRDPLVDPKKLEVRSKIASGNILTILNMAFSVGANEAQEHIRSVKTSITSHLDHTLGSSSQNER